MDPRPPTREELAKFFADQRSLVAFERLFEKVGVGLPSDVESAALSAGNAEARATIALGLVQMLADLLDKAPPRAEQHSTELEILAPRAEQHSTELEILAPRPELGTMAPQQSHNVSVTGGAIDGTKIGETEPETAKFGRVADNSEFEEDGTLTFNGDATVWKDIMFPQAPPKTTGTGNPSLVTWNGALRAYSYAVGAAHDFDSQEIEHDAKIGSTAYWHLHIISRDTETERTVKYQLEYALDPGSGGIPAPTPISAEIIIPASSPVNTPVRFNLGSFTVPGIGRLAYARLTRIASSGTEPSTDPVVAGLHFHYELDTVGSRSIVTK